jgi:hypothetical protein
MVDLGLFNNFKRLNIIEKNYWYLQCIYQLVTILTLFRRHVLDRLVTKIRCLCWCLEWYIIPFVCWHGAGSLWMYNIFFILLSFLSYNLEIRASSLKIDCVFLFISLLILVLIFFITFCFALMPFEVFFFCFVPRHFISFNFFYPI